jgi:acetyltransferase-like isoleucine patch superfamily enzyme
MSILKNILHSLKDFFYEPIRLAQLHRRFPTCRIYPGASVDASSHLGKYNVIFKNTAIIESTIGDHTFVQKESVICNATVGKFCSIAMRVSVGLGQHPTTYVSSHPAFYSATQPIAKTFSDKDVFEPFQKTEIGHDVWIGQGVMVKTGVRIGTGAVIGVGSIVTKDIPPYIIAAGNPCRPIRQRFSESIVQRLLESRWWELDDLRLEQLAPLFSNPELLLEKLERNK